MSFELSPQALEDLQEIETYLVRHQGQDLAERTIEGLVQSLERIADFPGLGHCRPDLTSRDCFIHSDGMYLIVYYRQTDPLAILAVLHSARNIQRILKKRL